MVDKRDLRKTGGNDMRYFVRGDVLKGVLTVTFFNMKEKEEKVLSIPVKGMKVQDLLYLMTEIAVFDSEAGDELIFISNDPRAEEIVRLDSSHIGKWTDTYVEAVAKELTLGTVRKDGGIVKQREYYETTLVPAEEVRIKKGELVNDGRLLIEDIGEYKREKRNIYEILVVPSLGILPEWTDEESGKMKTSHRTVGIGDTRFTRFFDRVEDPKSKVLEITDLRNRVLRLQDSTIINRPVGHDGKANPFILFEGSEMPAAWIPKTDMQWAQWRKSVEVFQNGLEIGGLHYIWAFSSAAGLKSSTAIFIRSDLVIPDRILKEFPKEYLESVEEFTAFEKLFDILSYGAYSKSRGKPGSISKFVTRLGLCLSTSVNLGALRVRGIGRVIVPWSDYIKESHRKLYESYGWSKQQVNKNLAKLQKFWKEDAWDGANIIRRSWAEKALREANVRNEKGSFWLAEELSGICLQFRYAAIKGLGTIVDDGILDGVCVNGEYIYRGYDLLAESNSIKLEWDTETFVGPLAPQFEMVGISKEKGSSSGDAQLISCLEFNSLDDAALLKERLKENVSKMIAEIEDVSVARGAKGVVGHAWYGDETISPFNKNHSFYEGYLQIISQTEGRITEPYVAKSIMESYMGSNERSQVGKFHIDGERWFMVPDLSPLWMGEYVESGTDFISGEPRYDIYVRGPEHTELSKPEDVWASGVVGKVASYRNPLNSAGEIVFSNAVDTIANELTRSIYENMSSTIVFSVFSASANLMGGGDFDGDRAMVIWDEKILPLIKHKDLVLVELEDKSDKNEVTYENMKNFVSNSLCNPGIGLITNYGTSWKEIWHIVKWKMMEDKDEVKLPRVYVPSYDDQSDLHLESLARFFTRNESRGWKGVSIIARKNLQDIRAIMTDWEIEAAEAIAEVAEYSHLLKKKILTREEFRELAPVLIRACEAAEGVVRYLQELAINTAKSDDWAFYVRSETTGELKPSTRYNYICILPRPFWKKDPERKNTFYDPNTPMGVVSAFSKEVYNDYYKKIMKGCTPHERLILKEETELYKIISEMVKTYNEEIRTIISSVADERSKTNRDQAFNMIKHIKSMYRYRIQKMLYEYDSFDVLSAAYTATYKYSDLEAGRRMSFVYSVLGDELLVYFNNIELGTDVMVPIPVSLVSGATLENGTYPAEYDTLLKKTIIAGEDGSPLGLVSCRVDASELEIFISHERAFARVFIPRFERKALNKDFNRELTLLGLSEYGYSEKRLVEKMRAKVGLIASKQAFKLGEYQDVASLRRHEDIDENGIVLSRVGLYIGEEMVGSVSHEQASYIEKIMSYGSTIIVEWPKRDKYYRSSARLKIVDVVAE